jgi:hypothetical protein
MAIDAVSLPFREQSEFFRRKLNMPTQAWTDIYREQHDWAFVVAGANRNDIVEDFRSAVQRVIDGGGTLQDFRKDFDNIVERHGWSYNGGRNWRTRIIYETNLNSSYMAGRYQQLLAVRETRPYWQYIHNDAVEHPRPHHLSWNGLILRWDDPWWRYHFPPGGWGCQCRVVALSEADLRRMGRTVDAAPETNWVTQQIGKRSPGGPVSVRVPEGIDPGFEYIPGQSRLHSSVPSHQENSPVPIGLPDTRPGDPLPSPQNVSRNTVLPPGLPPENYARAFLEEFGATMTEPAIYQDVVGESLVVGREMFAANRTGEIDDALGTHGSMIKLLAETLKNPDEIWTRMEWYSLQGKAEVRRRYLARYLLPDSQVPVSIIFEYGENGWVALLGDEVNINDQRIGVRLFKRKD